MIPLIVALLGNLPSLLAAVQMLNPPQLPGSAVTPPPPANPLPAPDLISVVDANAVNKANLDAGQAVVLTTYPEGGDTYTVVVFKNGGSAASSLGL